MGQFENDKIAKLEAELELYKQSDYAVANKVEPAVFVNRLTALGWREIPSKREHILIFQFIDEKRFFQVNIPESHQLGDYAFAMANAAKEFALFSDKQPKQVLVELVLASSCVDEKQKGKA